jgi:acetyl esterase/lipase
MKFKNHFLLLFCFIFLSSCTNSALFLINNLAKFGDYTLHQNIIYGEDENQNLDLYLPSSLPENKKENRITIVFFYGGCWGACSDLDKQDYRFVAQAFTENNMNAVIVNYRQFPDVLFPAIMSDASLSVEWVAKNIATYGGNPENIILMGHSAGAHIASMLLFNKKYLTPNTYPKIKGFIGLAGPYDFLPYDEWYQPKLFSPINESESQTINYVDGSEPPSLLMYGNEDSRVKRRNIVSLTKIIKAKKGKVEPHYYNNIDHVDLISALSIPYRSSQPVMSDIIRFIQEVIPTNYISFK